MTNLSHKQQLSKIISMIETMTTLNFSNQLETNNNDELDVVAQRLNKLSKKLEQTVIRNNDDLKKVFKEASDYKHALDQSAIVAITDTKGDILYVNDMFCEISKYSKKELIGQNQRIVNSGYHTTGFWKQMWATIGSGNVWRKEIKNQAKDGTYYWVDTTIVPYINEKGKPEQYLSIRHDITDRKQREEELEVALKEVRDYKLALDQSAIVAITDTKGDIEYVNEMFCKISKFTKSELIGQNQSIVNSNHHSANFWKQMWMTIGKGDVWRNEIKNKAKDGSYYWVDTTIVPFTNNKGKPVQYLAIRHDISQRKEREVELEEALKVISDYKYSLDQSAIVAVTNTKGDIEYVNEMFCKISKYSVNELIGQNQSIVNSGHHPKEFWKNMWATIGKGKVWRDEIKNRAKDGTYYWVDTTIVPFITNGGKPDRYLAIRHDITERKRKESESERYRQELELANESLEKFAYTAAHDMKSPLNSAGGIIRLIEMELSNYENEDIDKYLSLLNETFDRSKQLINGILKYSKSSLANLELEPVQLGQLISRVGDQYKIINEVEINIDGEMPTVLHYETALSQILENLISNAVKYNDKEICQITLNCIDREHYYEISISDNGPGIKDEDREKVFDLFENLKTPAKDSTGIGLATVKKLVNETGGRIWVESSAYGGAKFIFTLNK